MAQGTSAPGTTDSGPDHGSGEQESTASPPQTGTASGVPLGRLLSIVVLSPAQAVLVAVQLLDATRLGGTTNGTSPTDARWTAALTPFGDLEVARTPAGDGTPVTGLLEQLGENARRLPAHPTSEQVLLLRRLEEVAADTQRDPGARARELEEALAEALGPGARQRLSGQLAALVDAFGHIAASVAIPAAARATPGRARPGPHRAVPSPPGRRRPPRSVRVTRRRRPRTRRTVLAVLLLTAALAGSGYVVLRDPDSGSTGSAGSGNGRSDPSTPADSSKGRAGRQRPDPRPDVGDLAGRSAGPITAVEVARTGGCAPGAPCLVTVTVRFRPVETALPIVWRVGSARSCRSDVTWSAPVSVTAQPGWTSVYATSAVPVPEGRSPALVALTTAPARAQSPPVPVTGSSLRC